MENQLTFIGLFFTFIGACLLFVYGLPKRKIGNVIISGDTAMTFTPEPEEQAVLKSEWQPIADKFLKKAKILNRTGFGLVAFGTLLQMIAVYVPG